MVKATKKKKDDRTALQVIADGLNVSLGKKIFHADPSKMLSNVTEWLSWGCQALNRATVKGLPLGRLIEIYGPPDVGKSTLAQAAVKEALLRNWLVVYIDTENALDQARCNNMGIDLNKILHMESNVLEDIFDFLVATLEKLRADKNTQPVLFVLDSIAKTKTRKQAEGKYPQGEVARMLRRSIVSTMGNALPKHRASLIVVNHRVVKHISQTGNASMGSVGSSVLQHEAAIRLLMLPWYDKKSMLMNDDNVQIGQISNITVQESNVGPPKRAVHVHIMFKDGIDDAASSFDFLTTTKRLEPAGGWYTLPRAGGKDVKFQKKSMKDVFNKNNAWDDFYKLVDSAFTEIYPD